MRRAELLTAVLFALLSVYLMWKSAELPVGWVPDKGPAGGAFRADPCPWTGWNRPI